MGIKIGSLFGDVSLRTAQLDKDIAGVGKKLRKLGGGMKSLGKDLSAKVTAPIVAIGVASLAAFGQFEAGMDEVKSLMPDLNQGEFVQLKDDVRDLAVTMGVDAVESTKALYQAISAGVPKENAIDFLRVSSQAAIAGVTDVTTAVDTLSSVLNAYKRDAEDAEAVADVLFTTVRLGKTTFGELGNSIFNVAPLAAAMNVPLEEVSAAVATLTKQGVPTTQAMTQIRGALVALQKPNEDMVTALGNLGFASGQALLDAQGLQGALETLRSQSGLTESELTKAFGRVEAFGAVLALTGQNFNGAIEDLQAVTNASGAMTQAFETNNQGLFRSMERAKAIIMEVAMAIGEQLAPYVVKLAEDFKAWYEANEASIPGWIELGVKIAAVAAVLGPMLVVMGQLVVILSNAWTWILALGVGLGKLLNHFGVLEEAGYAFGDMFTAVMEGRVLAALGHAIRGMWEFLKTFNPLIAALDFLGRKAIEVFNWIARKVSDVIALVGNLIAKIGQLNPLRETGHAIGDWISDVAFRADGGPVSAGSPYIVGERGPELFVPRYSGAIVPNHAMGGGGGQTIKMTFNGVGMEIQNFIKNHKGTLGRIAVEAVREDNFRRV